MAGRRLVVGVDSSTTATKVIAFDINGRIIAEASSTYAYDVRHPGWAEQDAERWWHALCVASNAVISRLSNGDELIGLAITHQRFSFVVVDKAMHPLYPAILWNDTRCAAQSDFARREKDAAGIFRITGYPPGQWTLYKLMWLRDNEPDVYKEIHKVLVVPDYLNLRLTGELSTSASTAAMTGALDIERPAGWAGDVIRDLGVRDDVWVEPVLPGAGRVGHVSASAAAETGLPKGLSVYAAAGDQPCGSLAAGVNRPGLLGINGGTSCSNEFYTGTLPSREKPVCFIEISPDGGYIAENDIPSGGSAAMNWYRQEFGAADIDAAESEGIDPWDGIFKHLDSTPPGNRGMMVVPYLQAVYGPYWNQNASGLIAGLRRDHTRGNLVRGLLEGVAYEARREAELIADAASCELQEIRMYGGSARNPRWSQLFADVFERRVCVPETTETTALGAAMCAAVGAGACESFDQAVERMVRIAARYEPESAASNTYNRYFNEVYVKLYDRVADLTDTMATIAAETKNG